MKKNRIAIMAVMSVLLLAMTAGCKNKKSSESEEKEEPAFAFDTKPGTLNIVLEVDAVEVFDLLSNHKADPTFRQVLKEARQEQMNTGQEYTDCFYELWSRQTNNRPLCELFATSLLRDKVTTTSSDSEVLAVLNQALSGAIDITANVLCCRLDKDGLECNIERIDNTMRLNLKVPQVSDTERLMRLITNSGNLEFWETYNADEVMGSIQQLMTDYAAQRAGEDYQLPRLNLYPTGGAMVGHAWVGDTMAVNQILHSDLGQRMQREKFLKLLWAAKSYGPIYEGESDNQFILYAIKVFDPQERPMIEGDVVVSAEATTDQLGHPALEIQLNTDGTLKFAAFTRNKINRDIAFVLEDAVLSAPHVNAEVGSGIVMLTNAFTEEETNDLAIILNCGRMPVPVRIIAYNVED